MIKKSSRNPDHEEILHKFYINDICIGVPCVIGKNGLEEILDYKLNAEEAALFAKSAAAVRATNDVLKEINVL
jgi:malate dehydrogenase